MDTITHGIAGALIGKAFFASSHAAERDGADQASRVVILATTLGAVFPDSDVFAELFSHSDLATIELHRGFTHSFLALPVFAVALAALMRWIAQRRQLPCPVWSRLAGIYAVGLASHILLDLITSFGTMIWSPVWNARVAWDLTFIIDFVFTGIVLLPQVAAWVYESADGCLGRGLLAWGLFSLCGVGIERLARAVGVPFSPWAIVLASVVMAALFLLPAWRGWGLRVARESWCRAGVYALAGYLALCAGAHYAARERVAEFAGSRGLHVERLGALPMPPSLASWAGLIRTPDGVYQAWFSLLDPRLPTFRFVADSTPNGYVEAVKQLPKVKTYLWFARFPVIRYYQQGRLNIVEFTDLRFFPRGGRNPAPFTFRVTLDAEGRVIEQGWVD